MKLYDEPLRKWLTEKYLIKKKTNGNDSKNIVNVIKNENENEDKENNRMIDDNLDSIDDCSKTIKLKDNNEDNNNNE